MRSHNVAPPDFPGTPDCRHEDLEPLFFDPDPEDRPDSERTEGKILLRKRREHLARQVCATCPFAMDCALHGLEHEEYGIWGGLSERDRSALGGRAGVATKGPRHVRVRRTIQAMGLAGFSEDHVKSLLLLWRVRQRQAEIERTAEEYGEVA